MTRADIMDMMDMKLRDAREQPDIPFGGCQIFVFGDLYQLPPVMADKKAASYMEYKYKTKFFYEIKSIWQNPFQLIELEDVQRQKDLRYISLLNNIRTGMPTSAEIDLLNTRVQEPPEDIKCITIAPFNKTVDMINERHLAELDGEPIQYTAKYNGVYTEHPEERPTDVILNLKVGAQVMMLRNDSLRRWANGSMAKITALSEDMIEIEINGEQYEVERATWTKYEYEYDKEAGELKAYEAGVFIQYPIRLAYAITIHKSQGQSFEYVCIDYSKGHAFAAGMTYVALSRCRSLEGLYLKTPLTLADFHVNDAAKRFFKQYNRRCI